jgi:hypothetical protein
MYLGRSVLGGCNLASFLFVFFSNKMDIVSSGDHKIAVTYLLSYNIFNGLCIFICKIVKIKKRCMCK